MSFTMWDNPGNYCHWCGEKIPAFTPNPRTGRHVFCPGGRCRKAHNRAIKRYRSRGTHTTRLSAGRGRTQAKKSDKKKVKKALRTLPKSADRDKVKSDRNAKK